MSMHYLHMHNLTLARRCTQIRNNFFGLVNSVIYILVSDSSSLTVVWDEGNGWLVGMFALILLVILDSIAKQLEKMKRE